MSLAYFYEPDITPTSTLHVLSEESSKHAIQVLRMRAGTALQLTDGKGHLYTAGIQEVSKKSCTVKITGLQQQPRAVNRKVRMAVSLLKNAGRYEWFLEKATEMGVQQIIPLLSERTERQHFRFDRMQSILVSAMLQSQQAWLPEMPEPLSFEKVLAIQATQKLVAHCEMDGHKQPLNKITLHDDVLLLIGPEGDFSTNEITQALQQSFAPVSLGNTRLRTETAAVVAAALLVNA
ncbi:RsmE family RNA methyltransferase [Deminuibacter soli]|uniref:Ribosomal RNA small subunit methyltransferase E n=1 Tax=Deminuibacter soli TaxID=2291815 RepID=A0A3E1NFR1_9BACT|nr:16S rRNA (uracil(1498)-N(3))-methyltransferase [Deminuibacter soli]RFM26712.1 16S rRNA (uracil(1498)-N(3))-methyltransferase [Deminuibacter soli]